MPEPEAPAAVNDQVGADTTATDSAPVENPSEVVDEQALADQQVADSLAKEETDSEAEQSDSADETDTEAKPQGKAEERKQQLAGEIEEAKQKLGIDPNTEIRDLVSARNAIRAAVEQVTAQAYQPATENDLLETVNPDTGEYYNPLEAKVIAMEQAQQIREFNTQVAEAQLSLRAEASSVVRDFPMFDETSPDYNPTITAKADAIAKANLIRDPNVPEIDPATGQPTGLGLIVGSRISPYELYKSFADVAQESKAFGQVQQQKATDKMLAETDTPSSAAPPAKAADDPFLKGLLGDK